MQHTRPCGAGKGDLTSVDGPQHGHVIEGDDPDLEPVLGNFEDSGQESVLDALDDAELRYALTFLEEATTADIRQARVSAIVAALPPAEMSSAGAAATATGTRRPAPCPDMRRQDAGRGPVSGREGTRARP